MHSSMSNIRSLTEPSRNEKLWGFSILDWGINMSRLPWFKHYNTAHQGKTLRALWDQKQFEAYSLFWMLLETISRWEDENRRGYLKIPLATLKRETGWNEQHLIRVLKQIDPTLTELLPNSCQTFTELSGVQVKLNLDKTLELFAPNWLKLQETRGGKRLSKIEQNAGRGKRLEVRSKKGEVRDKPAQQYPEAFNGIKELLTSRNVSPSLATKWIETYSSVEWLTKEINKAILWEIANGSKKRNFGLFMTNWFSRDNGLKETKPENKKSSKPTMDFKREY